MESMLLFWGLAAAAGIAFCGVWLSRLARKKASAIPVEPICEVQEGRFLKMAEERLGSPSQLLQDIQEFAGAKSINFELLDSSEESHPQEAELDGKAAGWAAAGLDAAIPAAQVWALWHSVDLHVFQAFEHLSHQQIDGIADLLRLVDAKGYAIETAGFANKLLGHLGEWHVQEHLIQAGVPVAMPFGTNEPGLDMWVGDHAVNVKTVADAGTAAAGHFADYPHIPIVVPGDAAHIPADALHFDPTHGLDPSLLSGDHITVVDDALSHADMVANTDHAINVLGDPGPHLHFPFVTLAVSGFREARLLIKGNTDVGRALKNVAVDTTAVGGGGAIGMKTGALIGSAFGPVGTVVGGLVGGVAGALAGRAGANAIKFAPLEEAKTNYDQTLQRFSETEAQLNATASAQWVEAQTIIEEDIQEYATAEKNSRLQEIEQAKNQLIASLKITQPQAQQYLASAQSSLDRLMLEKKRQLKSAVPVLALPWSGFFAPELTSAVIKGALEVVDWKQKSDSLVSEWNGSPEQISQCFDLVLAVPTGDSVAGSYLEKVRSVRMNTIAKIGQLLQESMDRMVAKREEAINRLRGKWNEIKGQVEEAIAPSVATLLGASDHLRSELRKAGIQA